MEQIVNGTYQIINAIGKGGTGVVYRAWHLHLRKYVALKRMFIPGMDEKSLRRETDILKNLHHPGLPQVYDFFIDRGMVYTVMDFIEGTDMGKLNCGIRYLDEETMLSWLLEMGDILSYLHSRKEPVIHSDIKPGNVIVTPQNTICLIDFNISLSGQVYGRVQGYSANFASPEQVMIAKDIMAGKRPSFVLTPASDVYSTGALFYYLMSGRLPVTGGKNVALSPANCGYSEALCNVINRCMAMDKHRRFADGVALRKALETLRKHTAAYRKLIYIQAASWVVASCLVGGGLFALLHGNSLLKLERFEEDYSVFAKAFNEGDEEEAEDIGLSILNNRSYARVLEDSEEENAALLHAMGDISYNKEDYESAEAYYKEALDIAETDSYVLDYALSLSYGGKGEQAETVLHSYALEESEQGALIQASIAMDNGDYGSAMAEAEKVCSSSDQDIAITAWTLMADIAERSGEPDEACTYLEEAMELSGDINMERKLAAMYMQCASDTRLSASQKKYYGERAESQYRKICASLSSELTDELNYALVLQYVGKSEESIRVLHTLDDTDYRVNMYLAFALRDQGKDDEARTAARKAMRQYEDSEVETIDVEALARLEKLAG